MPSVAFSRAAVKTDHALAVALHRECKTQPWAFLALFLFNASYGWIIFFGIMPII